MDSPRWCQEPWPTSLPKFFQSKVLSRYTPSIERSKIHCHCTVAYAQKSAEATLFITTQLKIKYIRKRGVLSVVIFLPLPLGCRPWWPDFEGVIALLDSLERTWQYLFRIDWFAVKVGCDV